VTPRRTPNAAESIAICLRREIIDDLADGDHIGSADQLSARFGVSDPTIRQAVRVLEAEGLVRVRPGNKGGFFASTPSIDVVSRSASALLRREGADLADFIAVVKIVAPELTAQVAASPDVVKREALPAFVEEQWAQANELNMQTAIDITVGLFREFGSLCPSPSLTLIAAVLADLSFDLASTMAQAFPNETGRDYAEQTRDGHRRIARAISRGDVAKARKEVLPQLTMIATLQPALAREVG
jgi:GntR family transcriptional repressor for pyruvate dehydrogenase complex